MIAVLPCRVTASLVRTHACWLGWSSSMTRCQAAARSVSFSTGNPALGPLHVPSLVPEVPADRAAARGSVPQVCPHLVNVAAPLWKQPVEAFTADRQRAHRRRSAPLSGPMSNGEDHAAGKGRAE